MLVLSRNMGEQIVLSRNGVEIGRILVMELARSRVRLGFTMPPDVIIDRLEIHLAKERGDAERETKQVDPSTQAIRDEYGAECNPKRHGE